MSDMKKLFKNESKFFVFSFVCISVLTTMFYQIVGGDMWRMYIDSIMEIKNDYQFSYDRTIDSLQYTINDLTNSISYSVYSFGFWMIIGISLIFLGGVIYKINRPTKEFVSTLPIKRSSRFIFDTVSIIIVICSVYIVLLINIASTWIKVIGLKELDDLNLNLLTQMKDSVLTAILVCATSIVLVALIALIDVVVSNGLFAIVIGIADYIYLSYIIMLYAQDNKSTFLEIMINLISGIFGMGYNVPDESKEPIGWIVLVAIILGLVSIGLVFLGVLLTNKINYAKSGLFYLDAVRYIHMAIVICQCIFAIDLMIIDNYRWYTIVCFAIIMTAIIFGVNYLITPRKIKN